MFELADNLVLNAKIKVVGVGGAGGNTVNTMIAGGLRGVDFIVANTDSQALENSLAPVKIQLGTQLTKGLGAGADPEVGKNAALETEEELREALVGADMVFVTAGLGGGTGTGGAPVISKVAKEVGALTVGVVTKPFTYEGKKRQKRAEEGFKSLREHVDTLIVIPNDRLIQIATESDQFVDSFKRADEVLFNAVQGISDIINVHGMINVDFADVKAVMSDMGMALMGTGYASGNNKAVEASQRAISSPLLEDITVSGAKGVLINITGGKNLTIHDINRACRLIGEEADENADIIFGVIINNDMNDEMKITVIATGFDKANEDAIELMSVASSESISSKEAVDSYTIYENGKNSRIKRKVAYIDDFDEDTDYEIPAYLRRKVD